MNTRRLTLAILAWLCTVAGGIGLIATTAQAAALHNYLSQITEIPVSSGAPLTGRLTGVDAMTVDSGHLWVAEHIEGTRSYRTDEFNSSALSFESQLAQPPVGSTLDEQAFGIAVGHSTPETQVYVGAVDRSNGPQNEGTVAVLGSSGSLLGSWNGADTPSGKFGSRGVRDVAIDRSTFGGWAAGDVYVVDRSEDGSELLVDVFKPEAGGKEKYVTQLTGTPSQPFRDPTRVAVDEVNGDVLVADENGVHVFEPEPLMRTVYKFLFTISNTPSGGSLGVANGLAVDGVNGDIYVAAQAQVYEFSLPLNGAYLGEITGVATTTGDLHPQSVAVDSATHDVFVGDRITENQDPGAVYVFGPDLVIPDVTTGLATNVKPGNATMTGTVNPDQAGAGETKCAFVWGRTESVGQTAACLTPVAEGSTPVSVQVELTGLESDTTYLYRLQASNQLNGTNPGEEWQDQTFTTSGPGLHGEWLSDVASSSATLRAKLDPHKAPASYHFEYDTGAYASGEAAHGMSVPLTGTSIGSGTEDVEVEQHVQGLSANTDYHYRVVVVSEVTMPGGHVEPVTFDGPDQTFVTSRSGSSFALPDGRAWELVSPPDKHGASISDITESGVIQAAADGGAITYVANAPTEAEPKGYANEVQILSSRGSGGWSSRNIATAHEKAATKSVGRGQEYRFFSKDLSSSVVEPFGREFTPLSEAASGRTPYLRRQGLCEVESAASACYWPLVTSKEGYANVPAGTEFNGSSKEPLGLAEFMGGNGDLGQVVIRSVPALTTAPAYFALYEWSAGKPMNEPLQLVSVLPESEGAVGVPAELGSYESKDVSNAISQDGSRVFWSKGHLYMRDVIKGETVRLDAVQPGASGKGVERPVFATASSDGSEALFTDEQRLTTQSGSKGADLYRCEIDGGDTGKLECQLTDVTPEQSGTHADVMGLLGGSEDSSYAYFVAQGVLSTAENGMKAKAVPGEDNLYVSHYDASEKRWGEPRFVAVLSADDHTDWSPVLAHHTARVSPDGRYVAFMSDRSLTGYDNTDVNSGRPDEEVFLYDARSQRLACASCDPSGARPVGVAEDESERLVEGFKVMDTGLWYAANVPGWTPFSVERSLYQSRYLSDNGRLFFDSGDALVPQDINGTEDVYEYEPAGVGGCTSASSTFVAGEGGCVGLISSGTSAEESAFLDASATSVPDAEGATGGGDVFFLTASKLVSRDFDTAFDVYDAHECAGHAPCVSIPVAPPECTTADACRAAPSVQPSTFGPGPSATFSGVGNVLAVPVSKPVVTPKSLTRAQKLANALKTCRQKRKGRQGTACERKARKRYSAVKAVKTGRANARKRGGR
jgi:hypothetical protein